MSRMNAPFADKLLEARFVCISMFSMYTVTAIALVGCLIYIASSLMTLMRRVFRVQAKYDTTRRMLNSKSAILMRSMDINDIWKWQKLRDKLYSTKDRYGDRYNEGDFSDVDEDVELLPETTKSVRQSYDDFIKADGYCYSGVKKSDELALYGDNYKGGADDGSECKRVFAGGQSTIKHPI